VQTATGLGPRLQGKASGPGCFTFAVRILGIYDGKLFPQDDGTYLRPVSIHGGGSLVITPDELQKQYAKQ